MNDKHQQTALESEQEKQRPNKSQLKREMLALREQAEVLCTLKPEKLEDLQLNPALKEALNELSRIKQANAQKRQLQFITRLLSEHENLENILEKLYLFQHPHLLQQQKDRKLEQLMEQLLQGEQDIIEQLLQDPRLDNRQQFLQTLRNAQNEIKTSTEQEDTKIKQKKLRKLLKNLL